MLPDHKTEGTERKNPWPETKTDGSDWDESHVRCVTSRPKHVRMQEKAPIEGLGKDGPHDIGGINTPWNNDTKGDRPETAETYSLFILPDVICKVKEAPDRCCNDDY